MVKSGMAFYMAFYKEKKGVESQIMDLMWLLFSDITQISYIKMALKSV